MTQATGRGYRNGLARRIWKHICREGGRWTPEEIADQFGVPRQVAALAMHNMTSKTGSLSKIKVKGRARFGITRTCTIPHGLTVEDLLAIGLGGNDTKERTAA